MYKKYALKIILNYKGELLTLLHPSVSINRNIFTNNL